MCVLHAPATFFVEGGIVGPLNVQRNYSVLVRSKKQYAIAQGELESANKTRQQLCDCRMVVDERLAQGRHRSNTQASSSA